MKLHRVLVYGIILALVSSLAGYLAGSGPGPSGPYHDVIVPAARIVEREVPGPERIRDRIVYRYVTAEVRALAPAGALEQVNTFCAPTVAIIRGDTAAAPPPVELIRSVTHSSALFPIRRGSLLVTSVTSTGDLMSRDYRVRDDFGIGSGQDSVVVRYGRLSVVKEVTKGVAWYAAFRALEAGVRLIR